MKQLIVLAFAILSLNNIVKAQESKVQWVTIKSANLKCWECKERLEKYLTIENNTSMESGIVQWKINLLQGEIKFQFDPDRVNLSMLKAALNNAGFDADSELATEESYKLLPQACKRATEGGGPQPRKPCHLEPIH